MLNNLRALIITLWCFILVVEITYIVYAFYAAPEKLAEAIKALLESIAFILTMLLATKFIIGRFIP